MKNQLKGWMLAGMMLAQGSFAAAATTALPRYDHIVIVIMENESAVDIFASNSTPYIHSLASQGLRFTNAHAVTHPSEPNYLALFSGSTQGIKDDSCPNNFSGKPNLGSQLIAAGFSFKGYSEDLPSVGYTGCSKNKYVRKHNPWVMFNNVPASSNQPFSAFPSSGNYSSLPTVSIVVPNQCNNMHDCPLPSTTGDTWLKNNIDSYAQWAKTHNSLLILTWDEDDSGHGNVIPAVWVGANIAAGSTNSQSFTHYGLLRTITNMYGLAPLNSEGPITLTSNPVDTPTSTNSLQMNQAMKTGQKITSSNGGYHFDIQGDGNMVTYSSTGSVVWTANTTGKGGVSLKLQGDANLVLSNPANAAVWSSGTGGAGAAYLILQSDGKLALRNVAGATVWSK